MASTSSHEEIPPTAATQYRSWGGELFNPRYENPHIKLTDIIPLVVNITAPPASEPDPQATQGNEKTSRFSKDKWTKISKAKPPTKTIFLPRSEYLKWFATDKEGNYIGSEPKKEWSGEELELKFGQFRPAKVDHSKAGLIDRLLTSSARGL